MMRSPDVDVCIIGAGPAGLTLAGELAQRGARVAVIESGDRSPRPANSALSSGEIVGYPYFKLTDARERGVGGSSLAWGKLIRERPLDDLDFHERAWVPYSGWPFGRAELEPYYPRAQQLMGLGPYDYSLGRWSQGEDGVLPLPDVETVMFQWQRSTLSSNAITRLGASPDIELMTNRTVTELVVSESGTSVDLVRMQTLDGTESSLTARVFVLAAGGIENPRLLLMSNRRWANGLGNIHDLVGRYFQEHPGIYSGLVTPSDSSFHNRVSFYRKHEVDGTRVHAALKVNDVIQEREGLLNSVVTLKATHDLYASDVYRSLAALSWRGFRPGRWPWHFYVRDFLNVMSHPVQAMQVLAQVVTKRHTSRKTVYLLDMDAEQAPNPDSRVVLGDSRDSLGLPVARLDWRISDIDRRSFRRTQEILRDSLRRSGLGDLVHLLGEEKPPVRIYGARHHIGTTRMNRDPKRGVVDANARVHGVSNLYIAGSSVFPTGGYANPTLTIVAMAIRLSESIHQHLRG